MPVALRTGEAVVRARGREEGGGALAGGELGLAAGSPRRGVEVGQVWVGQQAGAGGGRGVLGGGGTGVPEPSPRSAPPCRGLWE